MASCIFINITESTFTANTNSGKVIFHWLYLIHSPTDGTLGELSPYKAWTITNLLADASTQMSIQISICAKSTYPPPCRLVCIALSTNGVFIIKMTAHLQLVRVSKECKPNLNLDCLPYRLMYRMQLSTTRGMGWPESWEQRFKKCTHYYMAYKLCVMVVCLHLYGSSYLIEAIDIII